MDKPLPSSAHAKVFYRPIEAAIRWTGLLRFESRLLRMLTTSQELPESADIPRWAALRLNLARLHDALLNRDLPCGRSGITHDAEVRLDDPDLTVRHVDLKSWMIRFYPDQRPTFLFDAFERHLHPAISIDAVQALLMDREALKVQLADRLKAWDALHHEFEAMSTALAAAKKHGDDVGPRSEATYLNIVGGLLTLLLGTTPNGIPYSSFETLESVITALVAHYGDRSGISERTLWSKFAAARRHLGTQDS
ncbi:hypothetical protein K6W12_24850 [Burkholderia multivorans]|uniref:hypothetical protein n=1 Tax=Burkholderia multivorans TaxID=87883 RepID=UPI001C9447F9|nr:hypothetical protein [Burkholderia multivorans]MBY4673866.1 hypothetical protein [Burkholderia multivorans]